MLNITSDDNERQNYTYLPSVMSCRYNSERELSFHLHGQPNCLLLLGIYSCSVINSQFVSFLVADGLEGVDQVSDDLHPALLRLLVLRHQVKLSDIRC